MMKFTLVCALLSVASLGSATAARSSNENGVVRVKGGDVVVLSGDGGRNSNNQIVIVDNSNSNNNKVIEANNDNGLADIIVIQGQNSYTMNNGHVNGAQYSTITKTVTSTVTATVTQVDQQTGVSNLTASIITSTSNTVLPANTNAAAAQYKHAPAVRRRR